MHRISKWANGLSILAAFSHIFCCGLPLLATILSLSATAGATLGAAALHDTLHAYELQVIIFAGIMLVLSGLSLFIAARIDCREDGHCHHEPCAPKKNLSLRLFILAAVIFAINVAVYVTHIEAPTAPDDTAHHDSGHHDGGHHDGGHQGHTH